MKVLFHLYYKIFSPSLIVLRQLIQQLIKVTEERYSGVIFGVILLYTLYQLYRTIRITENILQLFFLCCPSIFLYS